jgi:Beta-galactosidase
MKSRPKLLAANENQSEGKGMNRREVMRRLLTRVGAGAALGAINPSRVFADAKIPNARGHIGLNFIRPDANRPGNYDFIHKGPWLVEQYRKMGVKWARIAFSWVVIQPEADHYDWTAYDRIVDACRKNGVEILATLGGHFDRPPVPAWAGATLAEVVQTNPAILHEFIRALAERYKTKIRHHEILNEPDGQHCRLTVKAYVEGILKPAYRIHKSVDPHVNVLPCSYNHLPRMGKREEFWDLARGYYDTLNLHVYEDWGHFRTDTTATQEEDAVLKFRADTEQHGEGNKPFWITEIGWWGTAGLNGVANAADNDPEFRGKFTVKPYYTGREYLDNPVIAREDGLRATWMKDMFPRMLAIPGCEKAFLWSSMDEFQGGWKPYALYGRATVGKKVGQADLWGVIAGDGTWRKSAYVLQDMLR